MSDVPLDINEGARGECLFELTCDAPDSVFADYEWLEEGKPYREWLMPAEVVNRMALKLVEEWGCEYMDNFTAGGD